jgi:hypothetical protein
MQPCSDVSTKFLRRRAGAPGRPCPDKVGDRENAKKSQVAETRAFSKKEPKDLCETWLSLSGQAEAKMIKGFLRLFSKKQTFLYPSASAMNRAASTIS